MALNLPPRMLIRSGNEMAQLVYDEFTSVIVGHAEATTTYRFYDELDLWLGPWGEYGYPIGYGKKYNILFSNNKSLNSDPIGREWVRKTTIELQKPLRDYVVERVKNGTIYGLTEPQLRRIAFASHPKAYTRAGLSKVALGAPELLPVIASIPAVEFLPTSKDFSATVGQVLTTALIVSPQILANGLAAMTLPAHNGMLRYAMQRDRMDSQRNMAIGDSLYRIKELIDSGEADFVPLLDDIISGIRKQEYPNAQLVGAARHVLEIARLRRRSIINGLNSELQYAPLIREQVLSNFPDSLDLEAPSP